MPIDDDICSPEALAEPYEFFRRLRHHDPVHWSERSRAWIITSHAEVCAAFLDERLSSDRLTPLEEKMPAAQRAAMAQTFTLLRGWMVFQDPPEHGRLRGPVQRAFTPRSINQLTPRISAVIETLLDEMAVSPECELIDAYAFPLPAIVIAELLGVPAEDRADFKAWSGQLSGLVFGAVEQPGRDAAAGKGAAGFTEYFERLIGRYEAEPAANLISALIAARDTGDALPPDQMVGACTMLLFGGHETTTRLIANGVAALLEHPEQLELLRHDPSLAVSAVEEFLRFEGPAKVMVRQVREPHERGGHLLREGDRVYLSVAGANRDPAVFAEPDRFDIARTPNPHLGFGHGLHFCLGAPLARLETRLAVMALLDRFPDLRLATERLLWGSTIIGRGVAAVPLRLH